MANIGFFVSYKFEPQGFLPIMNNTKAAPSSTIAANLVAGVFSSMQQLQRTETAVDTAVLFRSARCSAMGASLEEQYATAGFYGIHQQGVFSEIHVAIRRPEKSGASCHLIAVRNGVAGWGENPDKDTELVMKMKKGDREIGGLVSMTSSGFAFSKFEGRKVAPLPSAPTVLMKDTKSQEARTLIAFGFNVLPWGTADEDVVSARKMVPASSVFLDVRKRIEAARDAAKPRTPRAEASESAETEAVTEVTE